MVKAETKININAPLEKVWSALIDVDNYPNWNPFVYKVASEKKGQEVDSKMLFYVRFSNGKETQSKEWVTAVEPPKMNNGQSAVWSYRFDGFLHSIGMIRANRSQWLRALPDGTTQYETLETFRGWGNIMVPLKQVQKGFIAQAKALKAYCEEI